MTADFTGFFLGVSELNGFTTECFKKFFTFCIFPTLHNYACVGFSQKMHTLTSVVVSDGMNTLQETIK